jgi:hypothetical protein
MRAPFAGGFEPPVKCPLKQMSRSANPATIKSHFPPLLCTLLSTPECKTGRSLAREPLASKLCYAAIPHQPMMAEPPFSLACPRGFAGGLWLSAPLRCFRRPQKLGQRNLLSREPNYSLAPASYSGAPCPAMKARPSSAHLALRD